MCGIIGYIGKKEKKALVLRALKDLEYRGYDSAGMAVMSAGDLAVFKASGKLQNLENKLASREFIGLGSAIGHTRWATHGKPTEINAHPHQGANSCVIHNGIIENYSQLKAELIEAGVKFISQTDTEVIVHLFEFYSAKMQVFEAFKKTLARLKGAYSILLLSKSSPDELFFAKSAMPLIMGKNKDELFFSSCDSPLAGLVSEVSFLEDGDFGFANLKGEFKLFNKSVEKTPSFTPLDKTRALSDKEGFAFFMEKEIYEQGRVLNELLMGRLDGDDIVFNELDDALFEDISSITLCACGTSYHAAMTASYLFERLAKIPARVEIASEFRYRLPLLDKKSLFIVISQSGETADTLEALKIAKQAGLKTLAICNVQHSSMTRLADSYILTRAGVERGVASTKAFATQVASLWMLAIMKAKQKGFDVSAEIAALKHVPSLASPSKALHEKIHRISKRYLHGHGFFFIGRDVFFPLALEGALKLKEISYLHAEGYPAGEMKHGPIALADSTLFSVALMPKNMLYEKTRSNVEELIARDSTVLAISPQEFDLSDDFVKTSKQSHYMCEFFEMMLVLQLFALEVSLRLGNDVDMPRNLAKSVTVE